MTGNYEDIIHLPHHTSDRHARMSMMDRAAQFAPFAAVVGYDAAIKETARVTDYRIELTEDEKAMLDIKLRNAAEMKESACITYFVADTKKEGGAYVCAVGQVKQLDSIRGVVNLYDGTVLPIDDIVDVSLSQIVL